MRIGFDQLGVPAPTFYRRVVNALIIIIMPAAASYVTQLPTEILSDKQKIFVGLTMTFILAILKGFEFILGSEDRTQPPK